MHPAHHRSEQGQDKMALEVLRQKQELGAKCWQSPALGDGDQGVTLGVCVGGIVELWPTTTCREV